MWDSVKISELVGTLVYTSIGVVLLWLCWIILDIITPFSMTKKINEEGNTALAIVVASIFVSIAIIIAAVILS